MGNETPCRQPTLWAVLSDSLLTACVLKQIDTSRPPTTPVLHGFDGVVAGQGCAFNCMTGCAVYGGARWGDQDEERWPPHRSLLRRVASCPPPAAIIELFHAEHGRMNAGSHDHQVRVIRRPVGEGQVTLAAVAGRPPGEGGVTAATGDTHRGSPVTRSNRSSPRPAGRAPRCRTDPHSAKSSALLFSDHCTPTPRLSVSTTTASRAST